MRAVGFLLAFTGVAWPQAARVLTKIDDVPFLLKTTERHSTRPFWIGKSLLWFLIRDSGYLVIESATSDGRTEEVPFSMPEWSSVLAHDLWGDDDGRIAFSGTGTSHGKRTGFIGKISPDRQTKTIIPMEGYFPQNIAVAPSGMIWTISSTNEETPKNNILARFDPRGKLLWSKGLDWVGGRDVTANSQLRTSSDRAAWLTSTGVYVEFDNSDGSEIIRIPAPRPGSNRGLGATLAITAANTVVISMPYTDPQAGWSQVRVWTLDRLKQKWIECEWGDDGMPAWRWLYGFNGDELMGIGSGRNGTALRRFRLSESK